MNFLVPFTIINLSVKIMFELSSGDYHSIDLVLFLLSGGLRVKADPCCHWSVGQQLLNKSPQS